MVATHYYRNTEGDMELQDRVDRVGWEVKEAAEEGTTPLVTIIVDDPLSELDYVGHRRWLIVEDESEDDDDVLYSGYTGSQTISHKEGEHHNPLDRVWAIELVDVNTLWSRKVMTGSDCDRPAETDVERMQWLLDSGVSSQISAGDTTTYVDTSSPVNMDAVPYRGQMFSQVADDCAQASGKNWFLKNMNDGAERKLFAFYGYYTYDSPLSLSNAPEDLDPAAIEAGTATTYMIAADTKLARSAERVYSHVYLPYEGGAAYRSNPATEEEFALGGRDFIAPSLNVKTTTKANARAQRYLADLSTQDDRITTAALLPKGKATMIRAGMKVSFRATHLPGYETARMLRVLNATPAPVNGGAKYVVGLELQGPGDPIPPDLIYSGSITIPGDSGYIADVVGATGWENDTTYGWIVTAERATGAALGASWGWGIGLVTLDGLNAAAYFDDADWLFDDNTIDSGGQPPNGLTEWERSGTFTTNDAAHFDASDTIYFQAANENGPHDGSTWTYTWEVWKIG